MKRQSLVKSNETPAFCWLFSSGQNATLWLPLPLVPVPVLMIFTLWILQQNDYTEMKSNEKYTQLLTLWDESESLL